MKAIIIFLLAGLMQLSIFAQLKRGHLIRQVVPGEFVALVKAKKMKSFISKTKKFKIQVAKSSQGKAVQKINLVKFRSTLNAVKALIDQKIVIAVGPNYHYLGDPREFTDPMIVDQQHHAVMGSPLVWKRGEVGDPSVIVAVTDDGVDLSHPDLLDSIWVNNKEIPGNGIDDDKNGYIDDYTGWDFTDNDKNPTGGSHGTHVAGIIAATGGNGIGVAGTASGVSIMPLRWYGGRKSWTTEVIAETYLYAMNNGAHFVNTSFNIDWLSDDAVYLETVKTLRNNGVIIFNSAGNSGRKNPKRQKIEDVVLVASSYGKLLPESRFDTISGFSNYGIGIDITAPGEKIFATCLGGKYCYKSGTSMAAPNAAAAAALIKSYFPKLTAEQVLHKLYTTTDNIDERNEKYIGMMGAGRINVAKATTRVSDPTKLTPVGFNKRNNEFLFHVRGVLDRKSLKFNRAVGINRARVPAKMKYSGSLLRVKVPFKIKSGIHKFNKSSISLRDVFGRKVVWAKNSTFRIK